VLGAVAVSFALARVIAPSYAETADDIEAPSSSSEIVPAETIPVDEDTDPAISIAPAPPGDPADTPVEVAAGDDTSALPPQTPAAARRDRPRARRASHEPEASPSPPQVVPEPPAERARPELRPLD